MANLLIIATVIRLTSPWRQEHSATVKSHLWALTHPFISNHGCGPDYQSVLDGCLRPIISILLHIRPRGKKMETSRITLRIIWSASIRKWSYHPWNKEIYMNVFGLIHMYRKTKTVTTSSRSSGINVVLCCTNNDITAATKFSSLENIFVCYLSCPMDLNIMHA